MKKEARSQRTGNHWMRLANRVQLIMASVATGRGFRAIIVWNFELPKRISKGVKSERRAKKNSRILYW